MSWSFEHDRFLGFQGWFLSNHFLSNFFFFNDDCFNTRGSRCSVCASCSRKNWIFSQNGFSLCSWFLFFDIFGTFIKTKVLSDFFAQYELLLATENVMRAALIFITTYTFILLVLFDLIFCLFLFHHFSINAHLWKHIKFGFSYGFRARVDNRINLRAFEWTSSQTGFSIWLVFLSQRRWFWWCWIVTVQV